MMTERRFHPINPERHQARVALLQAAQPAWAKGKDTTTGEIVHLVPSQTKPGVFHRVTTSGCDCKGYSVRKMCSHYAAVMGARA